jgi:hypothetical protein
MFHIEQNETNNMAGGEYVFLYFRKIGIKHPKHLESLTQLFVPVNGTTILLSVSMNSVIPYTSYKWNTLLFVPLYLVYFT